MRTQSTDTSPEAERVLIDLLRKAPVAKRFGLVRSMTIFAARLNLKNIQEQQPDTDREEEIAERFIADHYNGDLAKQLHAALQYHSTKLTTDLLDAILPLSVMLEKLQIPYYIQGTIANSFYGMQRATFEVDVVADFYLEQVGDLQEQLKPFYAIDVQVMRDATCLRTYFKVVHIESLIMVKVLLSQMFDFERQMYQRVQHHKLSEDCQPVCVASPEDIILTQLRQYRIEGESADDQWNEILGVLKVQGTGLDFVYLEQWAQKLEIVDLLRKGYVDAGLQEA
jgi:hypothetical protein